eukprot:scaffold32596_cov18-Tisochrysis_lutea.AAC.1
MPEGIADLEISSGFVIGSSLEALPGFSAWLSEVSAISGVFAAWSASASAPSSPRTLLSDFTFYECAGISDVLMSATRSLRRCACKC